VGGGFGLFLHYVASGEPERLPGLGHADFQFVAIQGTILIDHQDGAQLLSTCDGHPYSGKSQTPMVTPAEPGVYLSCFNYLLTIENFLLRK
jgi:hypothetical protein